ncbi:MAG: hypothetical protein Phog2KO_44310 [Phototrophicaceae bacterium]
MGDEKEYNNLDQTSAFESINEVDGRNIKTSKLTLPDNVSPMIERLLDPNSSMLTFDWQIQFKIGDQKKTLPIHKQIMVGREVESASTHNMLNFDLTPFGAYHFGVSRNHAIMSLDEGYLYLEDLGSTNGTRINGFQLTAKQKYRLRDGDEVEFARLRTNIIFKDPEVE